MKDNLFPPVAAHEEQWEDEAATEKSKQVASSVALVGLVSYDEERGLVEEDRLNLALALIKVTLL